MKFYGKFYVVHSNVRVCIQEYDVDKNKLPDESLQGVCVDGYARVGILQRLLQNKVMVRRSLLLFTRYIFD